MPIAYRVIQSKDFVQTTATGKIDLEKSRIMLLKVASLIDKDPESFNILLDVSDAYSVMTQIEIENIVSELCSTLFQFQNKIAIVFSGEDASIAKHVESIGRQGGLKISFFTILEEAIDWLNDYTYFTIDYDLDDDIN